MLDFGKEPVVLISLNKYMPLEDRKRKNTHIRFGNLSTKLRTSIYQLRTKLGTIKALTTFC